MQNNVRYFLVALKRLYKSVLGFEEGTDKLATIEDIKKDISFRGHSAWILMFSIFIASIGLNVNSTAVIIGAMLISPLMGPILGIGLSIGINDFDTLIRSFKNLGIAIFIALFTSTLYFLITPLSIEQSEILARTKPTILDVAVALFGGFAGIIAGSRKEKTNVIPGVAIATALMPPLCTAGYGLATFKLHYFLGAFYLFFINSVFISLATFIVVRYLKFPVVGFVSSKKLKRYHTFVTIFVIITIIPSTIIFYRVIQETRFRVKAENFVNEKCNFDQSELLNYKIKFSDTLSTIDLYYIGKEIDQNKQIFLEDKLEEYGLTDKNWLPMTKVTRLRIHQEKDSLINLDERLSEFHNSFRLNILEDIYTKNNELIKDKDIKIKLLEDEIIKLSKKDTLPFYQLNRELGYHFPAVRNYSFAHAVQLITTPDTSYYDTLPVFLLNFDSTLTARAKKEQIGKSEEWLKIRLENPNVKTLAY